MQSPFDVPLEETKKICVLIADDEDSFRKSIIYFLTSTKRYEADAVDSGIATLEALHKKKYDVLILDYKMPGISGLQVMQKMQEEKMDIPVVMLTGAGSENIAVEAMKLGAYDYIRKDLFDMNHMSILVNGVYERYLFKKERTLYEELHKQQGHNVETAELTRNYISISAQLLNTTLSVVAMIIEDTEKELKTNLSKEVKLYIEEAYRSLKESYKIISFGTNSLLDLTRIISKRLEGSLNVQHDIDELDDKLATLKEKMRAMVK